MTNIMLVNHLLPLRIVLSVEHQDGSASTGDASNTRPFSLTGGQLGVRYRAAELVEAWGEMGWLIWLASWLVGIDLVVSWFVGWFDWLVGWLVGGSLSPWSPCDQTVWGNMSRLNIHIHRYGVHRNSLDTPEQQHWLYPFPNQQNPRCKQRETSQPRVRWPEPCWQMAWQMSWEVTKRTSWWVVTAPRSKVESTAICLQSYGRGGSWEVTRVGMKWAMWLQWLQCHTKKTREMGEKNRLS